MSESAFRPVKAQFPSVEEYR